MQTHLRRAAEAAEAAANPVDDALICQPEAKRLAGGVSDMTMWRWRKDGVIPQPMSIRRRNYWRRGEFLAALEAAADPAGRAA